MPNTLWLWVFRALSSQGILSQRLRGGLLSNDKSRTLTLSSQPFMVVGGGLFIATRQPTWFVRNDPRSLRNWHVFQRPDFKLTRQLYLGYKQSWLVRLWTRFALIVFTRRHRFWLSITSVILTGSLGPHLTVRWFLWLNTKEKELRKI